uniref:Uncharacterized protein n=1 Tax=Arundo donax TaxID=35708 RepID=A0A0A8YKA5_ARUDO
MLQKLLEKNKFQFRNHTEAHTF